VYSTVLTIHSWLRWVALLLAIGATLNAMRRDHDLSRRPPGARWDTFFMLAVDLQVLFGMALYFGLSPLTTEAMNDIGRALGTPTLRFWIVEHAGAMLVTVVIVRVGRILALSARSPESRRMRRTVCFALATILMLAAIPWPGFTNGRPLFRL
jgi:hypothetical protein